MLFHEINLPQFIEVFAIGYPQFNNACATTISGAEIRQASRQSAKQHYIIKNCRLSLAQFEQFNSFFRARQGQLFGFRLKDHGDWQARNQVIGQGDDATKEFPLIKLYQDPINPYRRRITKPVSDSVTVQVNGNEAIGAVIDYKQGLVNFEAPPAKGQIITASFAFDVPVRFACDSFEYFYSQIDGAIELANIELREVLL